MTVTNYTDAVEIDGSQDITQLTVQGHSAQTNPLQQWENNGGDPVAKLHNDGQLQVGDAPKVTTPNTLIEAHRNDDPMTSLQVTQADRGLHTSGYLEDEGGNANIEWSVHEVTLAGDSTDLGNVVALRAGVTKQGSGVVDEAIGLEISDISGATDNYAIKTGQGKIQLGDLSDGLIKADASGNLEVATFIFPKRASVMGNEFTMVTSGKKIGYVSMTGGYDAQNHRLIVHQSLTSGTPQADNGDEFSLSVLLDAGTYEFHVLGAKQNNLGILDWYLDDAGSPFLSGQDWYSSVVTPNVYATPGTLTISTPGYHKIRGKINGKNTVGPSLDYYFLLTNVWIKPSSDPNPS